MPVQHFFCVFFNGHMSMTDQAKYMLFLLRMRYYEVFYGVIDDSFIELLK